MMKFNSFFPQRILKIFTDIHDVKKKLLPKGLASLIKDKHRQKIQLHIDIHRQSDFTTLFINGFVTNYQIFKFDLDKLFIEHWSVRQFLAYI